MFYVHIFVFHIFTLRVHWAQRTKRKDELLCNKPVYRVSDQFVWVCLCVCVELLKWRRMKEVKWESIRHKLLSWSQSMELIYNVLMLSNISSIKNTMLRNTLGFYYYDATLIILCELNWIDAEKSQSSCKRVRERGRMCWTKDGKCGNYAIKTPRSP